MLKTATKSTIKDVALLLRISRDKGEGIDTLENHRNRLLKLCNDNGWNPTFYEEVVSGYSDMDDREALTKLLQELHQYDALLVVSPDRIARRLKISAEVLEELEKLNIPLITPDRTYYEKDLLILKFEFVMAEQEYKMIAKRMRSGKIDSMRKGQFSAGSCPIGYRNDREKKQLQIVPEEAEIVKLIYKLALSGFGANNILKELKAREIKTKRGKDFSGRSVLLILHNEAYTGTLIFNVKDKKGNITETIKQEGCHEAIISKDDWLMVQKVLKQRESGDREVKLRNKGRVLSVLKDLIFCDSCGWKHGFGEVTNKAGKVHIMLRSCKKCGASGLANHTLVSEFNKQLDFTEEFFRKEWQKALNGVSEVDKESLEVQVTNIEKQLYKLNKRLENALEMRLDGELSKEKYQEVKSDLEKQISALNIRQQELQQELNNTDTSKVASDYEEKLNLLKQARTTKDIEEANRLLKLIIDKVYYTRHKEYVTGSLPNGEPEIEYDYIEMKIAPR